MMVSPEVLRRYPLFAFLNHDELREVAMISEEIGAEAGEVLFEIDSAAETLYLLMKGEVDLHYVVVDEYDPSLRKDFLVGTINPGELLGLSSMIRPYVMMATAVVTAPSRLLKIDALALRALCEKDVNLACGMLHAVAEALRERLQVTRIQLAAATA